MKYQEIIDLGFEIIANRDYLGLPKEIAQPKNTHIDKASIVRDGLFFMSEEKNKQLMHRIYLVFSTIDGITAMYLTNGFFYVQFLLGEDFYDKDFIKETISSYIEKYTKKPIEKPIEKQ